VATAFVNGRISERSLRRYNRIRPLIGPVLGRVDLFSMAGEQDARRVQALGAPASRIMINGNAKYDIPSKAIDPATAPTLTARYQVAAGQSVVVAGSIRGEEDHIVLQGFARIRSQMPDCLLLVVPRHVHRAASIAAEARKMGFSCQLRSDLNRQPRQAQVVVIDTMGELFDLYSIASVVFCGASLVPLGGQNVLEPAAWAKPVLFGPFMDDFAEAGDVLIQSGGARQVTDADDLARRVTELLANPGLAAAMGSKARQAVRRRQGAARRHAAAIRELVERQQQN
jgi:3-deoxy-D-manno-octulosonic-acid transferase